MSPSPPDPFLFIVGCGRSGTTLLRAMCDAHPQLAVPPESHFVVAMAPSADRAHEPVDVERFVARLAGDDSFALWGMGHGDVRQALGDGLLDYPTAVRAVFRRWAAGRGKARYADKTPVYVLHIARLAELFPEAVFVHLVRDGRDVAASFLELGWSDTIEEAALHWQLRVTRGRRAGRRLGAGRYIEVAYEALVADPGPSLQTVCGIAGLELSPSMLDPSSRADEVLGTTRHPEYHRHLVLPPTAGLRDWRNDLDAESVARFEAVAGRTLEAFGYRRTAPRPTIRGRVTAAAHVARWQAHRVRRRVAPLIRRLPERAEKT